MTRRVTGDAAGDAAGDRVKDPAGHGWKRWSLAEGQIDRFEADLMRISGGWMREGQIIGD